MALKISSRRASSQIDLLFLSLCLMSVLTAMEMDIFTPSFPELMETFSINIEKVQLSLSLNFVAYALSTLWVGPLAERFGTRQVSLAFLLIFVVGSVFCYAAPTFEALLIGRVMQGLGMSAPNVLCYVIIYDVYPESRESYMGIINGIGGITMGAAPVLGSYLDLWFGWRASFLALLLLSILCFFMCFKTLPVKKIASGQLPSLSLSAYGPLLRSKLFLWPAAMILCIAVCYFVFVGMAPIFYREDLGVSLKHYGIYQGFLASSFGVISFFSGYLYKKYTKQKCFEISLKLYIGFGIIAGIYGFFTPTNPFVLTAILASWSMSCAIPISIAYPMALDAVDGAAARASGLLVALRLIFSAAGLQVMAHFYNHSYSSLAVMIGCTAIGLWFIAKKVLGNRHVTN